MSSSPRWYSGLFVLAAFLFCFSCFWQACQEVSNVGLDLDGISHGKPLSHKSFSLGVQTSYHGDSLLSSKSSVILVGAYQDPRLGNLQSHAFIHPKEESPFHRVGENDLLDSISFVWQGIYRQGHKKDQVFDFYELNTSMSQDGEDPNKDYFSSDSLSTEQRTFIGQITRRIQKDYEKIDLYYLQVSHENAWARDFFNRIKKKGVNVYDVLQTFVILPREENDAILGFSPEHSTMKVFYRGINDSRSTQRKTFLFSSFRFNRFIIDEVPIPRLLEDTQHAYTQAGVGLFWKVNMNPLKNWYDSIGKPQINTLSLSVGPILIPPDTHQLHLNFPKALRIGYLSSRPEKTSVKTIIKNIVPNDLGYLSRLPQDFFFTTESENLPHTYSGTFSTFFDKLPEDTENQNLDWVLYPEHYNRLDQAILAPPKLHVDIYYHIP
ncbi:MAG: hypothetical protein OXB93_05590 [Cytophagales bacterium]|nr:hypothetical protein [Cytophagales bacterium]